MEIEQYCDGLEKHLRELTAENDKLREELSNCKMSLDGWVCAADKAQTPVEFYRDYSEATMRAMQALLTKEKQCAEAAEFRLKEAEKQEPCKLCGGTKGHWEGCHAPDAPLYTRPAPSPDVAELQVAISDSAKDELISKAVTAAIGPDWTLESLRGRLHYIVQPDKVEVFMLDEKPIIEFHPVEFDYAVELGQTKILYTQNYRIMNQAPQENSHE